MIWQAEYYDGTDLLGVPVAERTETSINLGKKDDLPKEVLTRKGKKENTEKFSARWTGQINGPGQFRFTFETDDGMRAWMDGMTILNKWYDHAGRHTVTINMPAGPHTFVIEYYNKEGDFQAKVSFERIGGQSKAATRLAWRKVTATGHLTRGGLEAARIYEVDEDGQPVYGSFYPIVYCMFNPASYKIRKSSAVSVRGLDKHKNYAIQENKDKVKPGQLTLNELWFDTSETVGSDGLPEDVSKYVDQLVAFAETTAAQYSTNFRDAADAKAPPPKVAFQWGTFRFLGVIESVKAKFVLFSPEGIPVRAKVSLKMKEFRHRKAYPRQNPSSGGGPVLRAWQVRDGDRLDTIAAAIYGDASKWRLLAEHNGLSDPMQLYPGQTLLAPPL